MVWGVPQRTSPPKYRTLSTNSSGNAASSPVLLPPKSGSMELRRSRENGNKTEDGNCRLWPGSGRHRPGYCWRGADRPGGFRVDRAASRKRGGRSYRQGRRGVQNRRERSGHSASILHRGEKSRRCRAKAQQIKLNGTWSPACTRNRQETIMSKV